jgi:hypothetical protein
MMLVVEGEELLLLTGFTPVGFTDKTTGLTLTNLRLGGFMWWTGTELANDETALRIATIHESAASALSASSVLIFVLESCIVFVLFFYCFIFTMMRRFS